MVNRRNIRGKGKVNQPLRDALETLHAETDAQNRDVLTLIPSSAEKESIVHCVENKNKKTEIPVLGDKRLETTARPRFSPRLNELVTENLTANPGYSLFAAKMDAMSKKCADVKAQTPGPVRTAVPTEPASSTAVSGTALAPELDVGPAASNLELATPTKLKSDPKQAKSLDIASEVSQDDLSKDPKP